MHLPKPPWTYLGKRIESKIRKALLEHQMISSPKIALALSGGKDSLTLLFMLKAISGRGMPPIELTALHVTGAFSCGPAVQEKYLREICSALDVPFVLLHSPQKERKLECYSCSRDRRRLIFHAALEREITTIAFGHHRDDNAQTLLLNLFHKGEVAGMLPKIEMVHFGVTLIRPLIYVAEKEIKSFAQENKFAKIICLCPVGQKSMRKQMDNFLNEMESFFPNVRENSARASLMYGSEKARLIKDHQNE